MNSNHIPYMKHCLTLAREAKANGKPGVGSVLVRNDEIIGEGIEGSGDLPAVLAHAEILAIVNGISKIQTRDLSDCTLYTTVEPCVMCSYIIRSTGIKHVVIGTTTSAVGGVTSNYPILTARDIEKWKIPPTVTTRVMEQECKEAL
jgi:tRNA(adenine34) deaminase